MVKAEQFSEKIARLFPPDDTDSKRMTRTITFQVTDDCNLKCSYCYQVNKGKHVMDFDVAKRFIDMLLDAGENANAYINQSNSPGVVIEFIGGEPFLEIELIDRITDYFIQQMILKQHPWATRYKISISSNGTLYFKPKVQDYLNKHINHLSFSISIDGNKKLHDTCRVFPDGSGSYDLAMRAVKHFRASFGGRMGSKMTIAPANVRYSAEAVTGLIGSGYTEINLNCVYEKGWTLDHAVIFYNQLKQIADYIINNELGTRLFVSVFQENLGTPMPETDLMNWCGGLGYMVSVDWKGDIYPCIRYMESALGSAVEPIIIGNVDTGIMATKEQCGLGGLHEMRDAPDTVDGRMLYCPIAQGCAWCSAYNYQETGSVDKRVTYICQMHRARVLANVYFWNKLYRQNGTKKKFKNNMPEAWALIIVSGEELQMLNALASEASAAE